MLVMSSKVCRYCKCPSPLENRIIRKVRSKSQFLNPGRIILEIELFYADESKVTWDEIDTFMKNMERKSGLKKLKLLRSSLQIDEDEDWIQLDDIQTFLYAGCNTKIQDPQKFRLDYSYKSK
jgi:hypothetical protein